MFIAAPNRRQCAKRESNMARWSGRTASVGAADDAPTSRDRATTPTSAADARSPVLMNALRSIMELFMELFGGRNGEIGQPLEAFDIFPLIHHPRSQAHKG